MSRAAFDALVVDRPPASHAPRTALARRLRTGIGHGRGWELKRHSRASWECSPATSDNSAGHDHASQPPAPEDIVHGDPHRVHSNGFSALATPGPAGARQLQENPPEETPCVHFFSVGLQLAIGSSTHGKLRHRLDLALVAERGLVAPYHLAHRVLRNPQIPGDLLDRNAPHQMIPTAGSSRSFPQPASPPPPRPSKRRGVHGHKPPSAPLPRRVQIPLEPPPPWGSNLDADYPQQGVNVPRLTTPDLTEPADDATAALLPASVGGPIPASLPASQHP